MPTRAAGTAGQPVAATPMAFARAIVAAYRRAGADPAGVLRLAQIAPAALREPDGRITSLQMEVLSVAAMQELDDEALGAFSRRLPWGSYGMVARAALSSPDLGVALKRWCRYHGLLVEDIAPEVTVAGTVATIGIIERRALGDAREFCLVQVLRNIHGLACWYIDSRVPLLGSAFPFAPPLHAWAYDVMFAPSASFGAARAEIRFDARYLGLPLRRDEKALRHMLRRAVPLMVLQYRRDRLLVEQVRQALAAHPVQAHSADAIAALLHMSARTLHRQLKEEGATLQGLKDEVRCDRAKDLLYRSTMPLKQVAEATGFLNEKSFIRAFRGWTGLTPGEFRRMAA
jgi:AraC-like DNA-binding protein